MVAGDRVRTLVGRKGSTAEARRDGEAQVEATPGKRGDLLEEPKSRSVHTRRTQEFRPTELFNGV